jgi:hypothetical protein
MRAREGRAFSHDCSIIAVRRHSGTIMQASMKLKESCSNLSVQQQSGRWT